MASATAVAMLSCAGPPLDASPPPSPSSDPPVAVEPDVVVAFDFENTDLTGWVTHDAIDFSLSSERAHGGKSSLRVECRRGCTYPIHLDDSLLGMHLRLKAAFRGPPGGVVALQIIDRDGNWGHCESGVDYEVGQPWGRTEATCHVPQDAQQVRLSVYVPGGVAWVDDVTIERVDPAPEPPPLRGRVITPDGEPVAAAGIAVRTETTYLPIATATTDDEGRFSLPLRQREPVRLTALDGSGRVAQRELEVVAEDPVELVVRPAARTRLIRVVDRAGRPITGAWVSAFSDARPWTYDRPSDASGMVRVPLGSQGPSYIDVGDALASAEPMEIEDSPDPDADVIELRSTRHEVAPVAVVDWLSGHAAPLGDPARLDGSLRELTSRARVIGIGESTHGTAEFVHLRRKLIESLVENGGVRHILLEESAGQVLAMDAYVQGESMDIENVLARRMLFRTAESLTLLDWLREHNAPLPEDARVHLWGIDVQSTQAMESALRSHVARYAADLQPFPDWFFAERTPMWLIQLPEEQRTRWQRHVERLLATCGRRQIHSDPPRRRGCHFVRALAATLECTAIPFDAPPRDYQASRDPAMARQVLALADDGPVVVLAHNDHVARRPTQGATTMGEVLAAELGDRYVAVALEFGRGRFIAGPFGSGVEDGGFKPVLQVYELDADVPGSVADTLHRASRGPSLFLLRRPPRRIRPWFQTPRPIHMAGGYFLPHGPRSLVELSLAFDAIAYTPTSTPTTDLGSPGWRLRDAGRG